MCRMKWLKKEFTVSNLFMNHAYPRDFVTLQCGPLILYPIWSSILSLYHFGWIITEIVGAAEDPSMSETWFIFLTNQGYAILVAYQWLDTIFTFYIYLKRKDILNECDRAMPVYLKILWVIYNIACSSALLIFLAYWILLGDSLGPGSINKHIMNFIVLLLNALVTAKPVRILHFYQTFLFAVWYLIFSAVYQKAGGGTIYSVLDWDSPGSAIKLSFPLVFIGVPLCHLFFYGIFCGRRAAAAKCCKNQRAIYPSDPDLQKNTISGKIDSEKMVKFNDNRSYSPAQSSSGSHPA